MKRAAVSIAISLAAVTPNQARADDFCEHVEAVASATSAQAFAPELFGTYGYGKETSRISALGEPILDSGSRVTAGAEYRVTGILEGVAMRKRASAECKRHGALAAIESVSEYGALEARARILADALPEADRILVAVTADLKEKNATAPELVAMRLRVSELRTLALEAQQAIASRPQVRAAAGALSAYYAADRDVEHEEGRLRTLQGVDVTVRGGYDRFLDRDDRTPWFAMVSVSINTGVLFTARANGRAAAARARLTHAGHTEIAGTTLAALEAELAAATQRAEQTAALLVDIEQQVAAIAKLGDDGRRYGQTLWFELVKAKADNAYAIARAASLRELLTK